MSREEQLFWKFGKNFTPGTILCREGEAGHEMFIIQKGKVQVRKKVGKTEKVLAELCDGEFFGEMALLLGMDRSATVEVTEDSKVLVVGPDTFESLLKNSPEIAMKMLKKMALRLRALDDKLETAFGEHAQKAD
jgi:CRP/FNR family transcriptional regulator, cyclic AMP receptor protein